MSPERETSEKDPKSIEISLDVLKTPRRGDNKTPGYPIKDYQWSSDETFVKYSTVIKKTPPGRF